MFCQHLFLTEGHLDRHISLTCFPKIDNTLINNGHSKRAAVGCNMLTYCLIPIIFYFKNKDFLFSGLLLSDTF